MDNLSKLSIAVLTILALSLSFQSYLKYNSVPECGGKLLWANKVDKDFKQVDTFVENGNELHGSIYDNAMVLICVIE